MWILDHHFIVCFCSNPQFCLSSFSTLNHHLKQLFLLFTTRTNTYHNHALTQHADTSHAACKTGTWRRSLQSWRTKMRRTFFHMFFVKRTFLGCWWFFYISCSSRNLVEIMYPRKFNENTPNIARYISPPKKNGWGVSFGRVLTSNSHLVRNHYLPVISDHHERRWNGPWIYPTNYWGDPMESPQGRHVV